MVHFSGHAYTFRNRSDSSLRFSAIDRNGLKLGFQVWMIAIYLLSTILKSVSSMKLHRDPDVSQRSAWLLAHRLRTALASQGVAFSRPVEVDEAYINGVRKNMPNSRRKHLTGRGAVGKTEVVGAKDRVSNQVHAQAGRDTGAQTLQGFVRDYAGESAVICIGGHGGYSGLAGDHQHEAVKHSVGEYVHDQAHTNGIKSFWSMLKRTRKGSLHKISPNHLDRYVTEFAGRHTNREHDTVDTIGAYTEVDISKRLRYEDLISDNGLNSGARS